MDATHSDRSDFVPPAAPWVGIVLSDMSMPARLVDGTGEVVWRTAGLAGPSDAAPAPIPVFVPDGGPLSLIFDMPAQDGETVLMRDLAHCEGEHRARNIVALALAIANQSLGERLDDPVIDRFLDRLRSLDAVARVGCEVEGDRCTVGVIARQIMNRFDDPQHRQIHQSGPPVLIPARWAHLLAIVLHELGANAIRHGSLRERSGQVQLRWCVVPDPERRRCALRLSWRESGGSPVRAAGARGFGSRILRDIGSVSRRCGGVFNLLPTGLDYRLTIELEEDEVSYG